LIRGQWRRLDARLRIQVGIVVALLAVFAFWQLRLRYAELALVRRSRDGGWVLLGTLGAIAAGGAAGTGMRLRSRLRRAPRGPEWAALPATGEQLVAHQAYEAELPLRLLWALALADWIAALPAASVLALAAALVLFPTAWVAFVAVARHGVAAAFARRVPPSEGGRARALLASLAGRVGRAPTRRTQTIAGARAAGNERPPRSRCSRRMSASRDARARPGPRLRSRSC
jgi:hypothetical protein